MFLVDTSLSMSKTRQVEIPGANGDDSEVIDMTNLEWSLQFVQLKIQEMVGVRYTSHGYATNSQRYFADLQW